MLGIYLSDPIFCVPTPLGSKQKKFPLGAFWHCVSDLLLQSKFPKAQQLKTINIYYLPFCGLGVSHSCTGVVRWFWHKIMSLGSRQNVSWGCILWSLDSGWRIWNPKVNHVMVVSVLTTWHLASSKGSWPKRESNEEATEPFVIQ